MTTLRWSCSAPLGCGIQTGAGTVLRALSGPVPVAVTGAGAVGLSAVMAARVAGATAIVYLQGRFPFDRLVRFYDFDQINQAAAGAASGAAIKPILRIG